MSAKLEILRSGTFYIWNASDGVSQVKDIFKHKVHWNKITSSGGIDRTGRKEEFS